MFKDVLNNANGMVHFAEIGLVIFLAVFVGVTIRTMTRTRKEIAHDASLPLTDLPETHREHKHD